MVIEPSISYGAIFSAVTTLLGFAGMYALFQIKQDKHVALMAYKVDELTKSVSTLAEVVKTQVQQNTRLDMHDKLIDELRHGEGYIFPLKVSTGQG